MSEVRFLFDEDFNGRIIRGLRRRLPTLDSLTAREAGLLGVSDPQVLKWAADEDRLLISHGHNTMRAYAEKRLSAGLKMAGLILAQQDYPIGQAIEELMLIGEASAAEDWPGLILFLPLE